MSNQLLLRAGQVVGALWLGIAFLFYFYPIRNVNILVILLTVAVTFFLIHLLFKKGKLLLSFGKWKTSMLVLFLLLFSLVVLLSLTGDQHYLADNHIILVIAVRLGAFLSIVLASAVAIALLLSVKGVSGEANAPRIKILLYALPALLVWLGYWVAYYPGAMTPDSLAQWGQAHTLELDNWHPVIYTLMIAALTSIWDSPASITLAQLVIISFIIGYTCYSFEKFHFPKWAIWLLAIVFAISPVNSTYAITIWKDVLYSAFLMLFTVLIIHLVKSNGEWIKKKSHYIFFFLTCLGVIFFRHNGLPVVMITLILGIILYRKSFKQLGTMIAAVLVVYFVISGPVFDALNVKPSDPNEALSIPTQQIATIIIEDGKLTDEQREYFNEIFPIELWKERFHPYNTNPIKFSWKEYDRDVIFEDTGKYFKNWLEACLQNPGLALKGFFTHTSLVWQIKQPEEPGYTDTYVTNVYYGNEYGLENKVINSKLTTLASIYLTVTKALLGSIIWRPAVYTYAIILLAFSAYLRNNYKPLLVAIPVLLNTAAVMAALPAQDFRYLYSNTMIIYLLIFVAFIHLNKRGIQHE